MVFTMYTVFFFFPGQFVQEQQNKHKHFKTQQEDEQLIDSLTDWPGWLTSLLSHPIKINLT